MNTFIQKDIVILANSYRGGGRCIAGIELLDDNPSYRWVRPIPDISYDKNQKDKHAFYDKELYESIALLDVISIPLRKERPDPIKYQNENWFCCLEKWEKKKELQPAQLKQYISSSRPILHTDNNCIPLGFLSDDVETWKSLELVAANVRFYDVVYKNKRKFRVRFVDEEQEDLPLTDLDMISKINKNKQYYIGSTISCYLTISLGLNFNNKYYKLVAAVI